MTTRASSSCVWTRPWFPFLQLAWVTAAWGIWFLAPRLGAWPVVAALLPWLVRLVETGYAGRRTPFDIPLVVFLGTAGMSLWAAYDPDGSRAVFADLVGRRKLWGLMLAILVFYCVPEFETDDQRQWLLVLLAGFGAAVSLWFVATNDWEANPALWDPLNRLGQAVQYPLPYIPGHRVNPNIASGLIAVVLPAGLELAGYVSGAWSSTGDRREALVVVWGILATIVMGLALLLTTSRGAFLGVGGSLCLLATWWLAGRLKMGRRVPVFLALVVAGSLLAVAAAAGLPFVRSTVLQSQVLANRLSIVYQASHLVRDYVFTGLGLGNFPFVHSTYVLLIHVPEIVFAHSTPVDVAVEQGVLGMMALVFVWLGAGLIGLRRLAEPESPPVALPAALLSLAVLVVHGLVDSTIYGSRALLLFWMPAGLVLAASGTGWGSVSDRGHTVPKAPASRTSPPVVASIRSHGLTVPATIRALVAVAAALALGLLLWRPLAAAWHANIGAVHQTLIELRAYDHRHFDDPTLDQVRQRADLSQAELHFQLALALDPAQVTARTRLAQIALSRGEYELGLEHAAAAWEAGYTDRVTRLVLSDALVAAGRPEEAAALVKGLEFARDRLQGQAYARYQQNGDLQRAVYAQRAALAIDPGDEQARQALIRAERKAAGQ